MTAAYSPVQHEQKSKRQSWKPSKEPIQRLAGPNGYAAFDCVHNRPALQIEGLEPVRTEERLPFAARGNADVIQIDHQIRSHGRRWTRIATGWFTQQQPQA